MTERYYTTSTAFLEALAEAGISYIFANLGSDHPGLIEALAQAKADGRADELPAADHLPARDGGAVRRPRLRHGDRRAAGGRGARRLRHPEHRRHGQQRHARPRPGARLRRHRALHPGRRAARQPDRVHPVDPGRARPARHPPQLRQVRQRAADRPERQAAGAPRAADRPQRARRPGLPDRRPRGDGGADRRRTRSTRPLPPGRPGRADRRGHRRDRDRAGRRQAPADRDVVPGPRPGRGAVHWSRWPSCWPSGVLEAMAYHVNFPGRPPAARRLPVPQHRPEPGPGRGRRGPGARLRRPLDPLGQPARRRRRDLLRRHRPAQVPDAAVGRARPTVRRRQLQGRGGADRRLRPGARSGRRPRPWRSAATAAAGRHQRELDRAGGGRAAPRRRDHPRVPDRVRPAAARRRGRASC